MSVVPGEIWREDAMCFGLDFKKLDFFLNSFDLLHLSFFLNQLCKKFCWDDVRHKSFLLTVKTFLWCFLFKLKKNSTLGRRVALPFLFVVFEKSDTKEVAKRVSVLVSSGSLQKVFVHSNSAVPPCRVEGREISWFVQWGIR